MIYGTGTDIVEISRVKQALLRTPGLVGRVFTPAEAAYCRAKKNSDASFAAMFAAKEAVLKSLGCGVLKFRLTEIEIGHQPAGGPVVQLHGKAKAYALANKVAGVEISLSHSRDFAIAFAIAVKPDRV